MGSSGNRRFLICCLLAVSAVLLAAFCAPVIAAKSPTVVSAGFGTPESDVTLSTSVGSPALIGDSPGSGCYEVSANFNLIATTATANDAESGTVRERKGEYKLHDEPDCSIAATPITHPIMTKTTKTTKTRDHGSGSTRLG